MTRLRCRAGRGRQEPQARRRFFRARAPASGAHVDQLLPMGPMMDVLPLSQKDRDAVEKKLSLKSKCEELHVKNLEMGKMEI
ncbi:hypothetical protein J1605_018192 [Eschrichtius robustus]|uniref:Uncharacterized protein n=1 Tax=Eschrichtius robustus TaxID=9764 RepID=A0AB34HXH5_ESCRO|nr:hypothetical protein J1605_018192 [Eschrichtius robustus]